MGDIFKTVFSATFFFTIIRMTLPIALAAVGSVMCERSGVLNLGLEGTMLLGAFFGFLGGYYSGNPFVGMLLALVVGGVYGLLYAVFVVSLGCNQVVSALGFNMLALGLTSTLYKYLFGITTSIASTKNLPTYFFGQNILFIITLLLVPFVYFVLKKTKVGLNLRAIGEYPRAAATVGVNVYMHRYAACIFAGLFAALGGVSLSIGGLGYFQENMVAGRGFIAFSAVIFGRYSPLGTLVACLIFGTSDALQLNLQALGVGMPYHFFLMMPYIITILAMVLFGGRSFVPRAQGTHYIRTER